jgi:hypothetical protein
MFEFINFLSENKDQLVNGGVALAFVIIIGTYAKALKDKMNALITLNDHYSAQIEKLTTQQAHFEKSVSATITVGLEDIRNRINAVTLSEILNEVPDHIKRDIESKVDHVYREFSEKFEKFIEEKAGSIYGDDVNDIEGLISFLFEENSYMNALVNRYGENINTELPELVRERLKSMPSRITFARLALGLLQK